MALFNLTDLRAKMRRGERLLGVDPGRRRIGLALSDVGLVLASPYGTMIRAKMADNAAALRDIARREQVGGLLVGLPLQMDGAFGPAAQAVRDWTRDMSEASGLDAAFWDERLSTAAVTRAMIDEADLSRAKRAERVDRASAAYTLQAALDATRPPFPSA